MTNTTPPAFAETKTPQSMGPFTSEALAMLVAEDCYRAPSRPDPGYPLHVLRSPTGTYYVSPVERASQYEPVTTYAKGAWTRSAGAS